MKFHKLNFLLLALCFFALFLFKFSNSNAYAFSFKKKEKPILILSSKSQAQGKGEIAAQQFFKVNSKIFFTLYNPEGFKSDYLKYQIVKQDNNAHVGGFTRIRNETVRVKNKNYYSNYFTLSECGKYFIQIFDIQNLQQWLAISSFRVVE